MPEEVTKLSDEEVQERLKNSPMWAVDHGMLKRSFSLPTFPSAIFFVNAIAHLAEVGQHHPDMSIAYNNVSVYFATHSAGGITTKDFTMVQKVDELWNTFNWTQPLIREGTE